VRTVLSTLLPFLFSGACAHSPPGWERVVVLDAGVKLGACAVGDLDPASTGPEIAAVATTGQVFVARRTADGWTAGEVARLSGEMIQCAIGDADPARPGLELATVGMREGTEDGGGAGQAHLVWLTDGAWHHEPILDDSALLHAVCVDGGGVYAAGFAQRVLRARREGGSWRSAEIATLPGAAKNALALRGKIVFACTDGSLAAVDATGESARTAVLDRRAGARARLGTDGERILVADDDGTLSLLAAGAREELCREPAKLRGAVLAELDPATAGLEAATAGYGKRVLVLRRGADAWSVEVVSEERDRLHHLACGDLDPAPGLELVTCGYSGELVLFRRRR
jgi:hypothetical protein